MIWKPTTIRWDECDEHRRELLTQAWLTGELEYKLDPVQLKDAARVKKWWAETEEAAQRWGALDCSRRYGKDTMMGTLAAEICIRRPGARVPYGAPTQKMVSEILEEIFEQIFCDCPPDLRPTWKKADSRWVFPNGSRIILVGFDMHPDRARGRSMDAWFLTEPGLFTDLVKVLKGVLIPQALTNPHACGLMGSTPSETPSHAWSTTYVPLAQERGRHIHRTLWDNPRVPKRTKIAFIEETGGEDSAETRREWYAEHVVDASKAVVPEFSKGKKVKQDDGTYISETEAEICQEIERPKWADAYVSLDPGWEHLCAVLFGYYHFDLAMIVVEDEFALPHENTERVADQIKIREKLLWSKWPRYNQSQKTAREQPYMRYSDTDLRMIGDLRQLHGLHFNPTAKDNLKAQVNHVRVLVGRRHIRIHPRCVLLRSHLRNGIWNKQKTKFAESDEFGHFDTLAALVYLVRNVNVQRNPNPPSDWAIGSDHFVHPDRVRQEQAKRFGAMLRRPKRAAKKPIWKGV